MGNLPESSSQYGEVYIVIYSGLVK